MEARLAYLVDSIKYLPQNHKSLSLFLINKLSVWNLDSSPVAESAGCSSQKPVLIHSPHDSLQPSLTPVPGHLRASLGFTGTWHKSGAQIYMQAAHTYTSNKYTERKKTTIMACI